MSYSDWDVERIRKEAASQGIENTIQAVEDGLGTILPRGDTPSESRSIMRDFLRSVARTRGRSKNWKRK